VDYLFLQVWPDRAEVSDNQNCGNLLAGVGPFAIESGLVAADDEHTDVRIWMENTSSLAVAHLETPARAVRYDGNARIDGVPGTSAPIPIDFLDVAGSSCGALLPTGNAVDEIDGVRVTCIDNGMPVVCTAAADFGLTGHESPAELEADTELTGRVESVRLAAGRLMNLGDVSSKTVPKMSLLSPARHGGVVDTRTFIPHRVHEAIGVFGAVSVATACLVPGSVAAGIAALPAVGGAVELDVEHPTGFFTVSMDVDVADGKVVVHRAALLRTARLLMRGDVFVPASVWDGS
jgi:4-oxalomesaconate tautomerase